MATDSGDIDTEADADEVRLGDGDTPSERIEQVDLDALDEDNTCTTDDLRYRLNL